MPPKLISCNDIAKIVRGLDPNNAHGHDIKYLYVQISHWVEFETFRDNITSSIEKGHEKKWYQFRKNFTSKYQETFDLVHYFQYEEKYLNE